MQKAKLAKSSPVSRKAAMAKIVGAYIRCEELSPEDRKRLIAEARIKITLIRALKITFSFAHGYVNAWSPKGLRVLAMAWLRLGETLFGFIYRWVKPRDSQPSGRLEDLMPVVVHRFSIV